MTKRSFRMLFLRALRAAADITRARLGKPIPRSFLIELHAPTAAGRLMSVDEALEKIYLDENRFYRIIDIGIEQVINYQTIAFVRVSGHPPGSFTETWDPQNLGPFKVIFAQTIEDKRVRA